MTCVYCGASKKGPMLMKNALRGRLSLFTVACLSVLPALVRAAEGAAAAVAPAAAGAPAAGQEPDAAATAAAQASSFYYIVFGCGKINLIVWILIFMTSAAALALIIDALITIKRTRLLPAELIDGVRSSLNQGDLSGAISTCEANPGSLSTILMTGFSNISEGYEVIQQAVASTAEMENEKLMQRVNYLNLCGQIAPMLGLLGTVVGMVLAFAGLATATGAAKSAVLALAISTALWTTVVGLLISVPSLLGYTLVKNYATRIILEMEATTLDLIKVLRNAEVEQE